MSDPARRVQQTYLVLTLLNTLAASFIWGVNTLFLLDAGLDNAEAFAANAFFALGQVIFEVPTGVVADTRGRRFSYLLGAATLLLSTLLYLLMWQVHAPLWGWAIASILLGLGFTFFSGATEAWLVDALNATGFTGHLELRTVVRGAVDGGFRNPPVRWLMLAAPFTAGAGFYVFYAAQPYLLQLYGDKTAYGIAGIAAALVAGAQIVGGLAVGRVRRLFRRRTDALILGGILNVVLLALVGLTTNFLVALVLLAGWSLVFAMESPLRQAFINGLIPSEQRATVLSFDSLVGSAGAVVAQPALGRIADVNGYAASYLVTGAIQALAVPFALLARREHASSDPILSEATPAVAAAEASAEPPSPA